VAGPSISDLAGFLLGSWRLDREVGDASRGGLTGHFSGVARFTLDGHVPRLLRYVEHGTLRLGAHRGPASRRLNYHVEGAWARVTFDDGRHFHDLDLREGVWEVEHACGDDRYDGRFEVDDAHRWRQQWTVSGPHKQQLIRTVLERRARGAAWGVSARVRTGRWPAPVPRSGTRCRDGR
jgi:hypothetical protein